MLSKVLSLAILVITFNQMAQVRDRLWATAKVTDSQSYGNGTGLSWVYAIEGAERFYNMVSGKPLPLAVGETIHISPDGTKLHIIDGSGKEHKLLISKQWLRSELAHGPTPKAQPPASVPPPAPAQHQRVSITIKSTPAGADIQLNGRNVGRTPTTTDVDPGRMDIMFRLESFSPWVITDDVGAGEGIVVNAMMDALRVSQESNSKLSPETTLPVVVYKVDPAYTQAARDEHISGAVTLKLIVSPAGRAENITVAQGLGSGLDEKAIDAIKRWRFKPATRDGKAVARQATIQVNFRLLYGNPLLSVRSIPPARSTVESVTSLQ